MLSMQDRELHRFTMEVMFNVVLDDLATVTNSRGEFPVVACLDTEPLGDVLKRVEASGGYATVFSKGRHFDGSTTIRVIAFIDDSCALEQGAERMTDEQAPDPRAPMGLFLDYLETTPNGVVIPQRLSSSVRAATSSHQVELQPA